MAYRDRIARSLAYRLETSRNLEVSRRVACKKRNCEADRPDSNQLSSGCEHLVASWIKHAPRLPNSRTKSKINRDRFAQFITLLYLAWCSISLDKTIERFWSIVSYQGSRYIARLLRYWTFPWWLVIVSCSWVRTFQVDWWKESHGGYGRSYGEQNARGPLKVTRETAGWMLARFLEDTRRKVMVGFGRRRSRPNFHRTLWFEFMHFHRVRFGQQTWFQVRRMETFRGLTTEWSKNRRDVHCFLRFWQIRRFAIAFAKRNEKKRNETKRKKG